MLALVNFKDHTIDQDLGNLFCRGADWKYFRLFRKNSFCHSYSAMQL